MSELSDLKARVSVLEKRFESYTTRIDNRLEKAGEKHDILADKLNDIHVSVAVIGQSLENANNTKEGLTKGGVMAYGGGAAGGLYVLIEAIKAVKNAVL